MHPKISINTLCFPPGPLGPLIDRVARLGARGISPELGQVKDLGARATAQALRDAGLTVATMTHRTFGFATSEDVEAGRRRLERSIALGAEIGADTLIMTTGGRGDHSWLEAAKRFADAMLPCADLAKAAGITLGIEPTSHLFSDVSIAHRMADTVALARSGGIAPIIDIFACWFDSDIEAVIADAGREVPLIQISDYVLGDRGLPCRAVPGDGAIPFERIVPALVRAGFAGWYDMEIIGPRLIAEGEDLGLARAAAHIGALLENAS